MEIQPFKINIPQFSPTITPLRTLAPGGFIPQAQPVEPVAAPMAAQLSPQQALRSWIKDYSNPGNALFERVAADPSSEGTLFRRGLMVEAFVTLP